MNYIDPTFTGTQLITINTKVDADETIIWKLTKEGNSTEDLSFNTPSTDANLLENSYYQELAVEFTALNLTLVNETMYILKGTVDNETVYIGKVYATEKDILNYSVNENKYTSNIDNNNFTILE